MRESVYVSHTMTSFSNFHRVSVSRAVKPLVEDARPPDYFSQKVGEISLALILSSSK